MSYRCPIIWIEFYDIVQSDMDRGTVFVPFNNGNPRANLTPIKGDVFVKHLGSTGVGDDIQHEYNIFSYWVVNNVLFEPDVGWTMCVEKYKHENAMRAFHARAIEAHKKRKELT